VSTGPITPDEEPHDMRRVLIMGAGGRDFHDFNVCFRDDPTVEVVAFTAAQIPGIDRRTYPPVLAGERYPHGIPIHPESELTELIGRLAVDEVVFAYSDLSHVEVMNRASVVLAAGADFRLLGPRSTAITAACPVVAVCATRTGCGKSPATRAVARLLRSRGLRPVLIRHPMPYGDLAAMAVQRFATLADIDAAGVTVEEREEYERPVEEGFVMYAGVDYEAVVRRAEREADVLVWDGGNNDFPFLVADVTITLTDALRPGHGTRYHPGETNLRRADIVVIAKTDAAGPDAVAEARAEVDAVNPRATVVLAASPVTLGPGPSLSGRRVLVVEDGPTVTHGGMAFGAGTVAARQAGAGELLDPAPFAVGEFAATFAAHPHLGPVLPAMGYHPAQLADLVATITAVAPDVVVAGTPIDLARLIALDVPVRRVGYEVIDAGEPTLAQALAPWIEQWGPHRPGSS
jgi:predicted GTPase